MGPQNIQPTCYNSTSTQCLPLCKIKENCMKEEMQKAKQLQTRQETKMWNTVYDM